MKKTILSSLLAAGLLLCSCGNADKMAKELKDSVIKDSLRKDSAKKADQAENEHRRADSIFTAHQNDSIDKASAQSAKMENAEKKK